MKISSASPVSEATGAWSMLSLLKSKTSRTKACLKKAIGRREEPFVGLCLGAGGAGLTYDAGLACGYGRRIHQ